MRTGKLRHRVVVERSTTEIDPDYGTEVTTWNTLATVPASVEPISGREFIALSAAQSEVTTRIRMRYLAMTTADRITHAGITYNVLSIINKDSRNVELELMCKSAG